MREIIDALFDEIEVIGANRCGIAITPKKWERLVNKWRIIADNIDFFGDER